MIAWQLLITLFLPIEVRVQFWVDFFFWLSKPIRDLEQSLIDAKVSIFAKSRQNSQQKALATLLGDLIGRSVVVTTLTNSNLPLTIYKREEGKAPVYIRKRSETSDPLYIYKRSEIVRDVDFVVSVSGNSDAALTRIIIAVVNRVKLAGKKYKIDFDDLSITP